MKKTEYKSRTIDLDWVNALSFEMNQALHRSILIKFTLRFCHTSVVLVVVLLKESENLIAINVIY